LSSKFVDFYVKYGEMMFIYMVPRERLELSRVLPHWLLRPACLPIPPPRLDCFFRTGLFYELLALLSRDKFSRIIPYMKKQDEKQLQDRLDKALFKFRKSELQQFSNYLSSPFRIFFANFLAGTSRGLGFFVGAALVIALSVFIITKVLSQIPIVGDTFVWLGDWIQAVVYGNGATQSIDVPPTIGG
jgi:hypothetical protein